MPAGVLKLDFRKAFDSVNSEALDTLAGVWSNYCGWIMAILSTGKTAV
jgi:hypothetical protein